MKCTTVPSPLRPADQLDGVKSFYERPETPTSSSSFLQLVAAARVMAAVTTSSSADLAMTTTSSPLMVAASSSPDPLKEQQVSQGQQQQQLLRAAAVLSAAAATASSHKQQQLSSPPPRSPSSSPATTLQSLLVNGCKDPSSAMKRMRSERVEEMEVEEEQRNETAAAAAAAAAPTDDDGSSRSGKRVNNNNTSSYVTGGGRLRFFKDGRFVLELTHRNNGDRGNTWAPITSNIFHPPVEGPTTTVKSESSVSAHSVSDSASIADGSSISSPWQSSSAHHGPHRAKGRPQKFDSARQALAALELNFVVKPPPCIVSLRKKVRGLRRKRRRPYDPILVGSHLMRIEAQEVTTRARMRPIEIDQIKKASRLEAFVKVVENMPAKKKSASQPLVQIQPWSSKPATAASSSGRAAKTGGGGVIGVPPPMPPGCAPSATTSGGVTRVRSELFAVTETCTAATMPNASPYHSSKSHHKNKAAAAAAERSAVDSSKSPLMAKTMPITPTMARIRSSEQSGGQQTMPTISSSLISPDLQRVKVEIGSSRPLSLSHSPVSLDPRDHSSHFVSPRKRFLQSFENGSPLSKKHRLSTDSRGSGGSGGGSGGGSDGGTSSPHLLPMRPNCQSPLASSPFSLPGFASSPPRSMLSSAAPIAGRSNSFSIDSIISKDDGRDFKPIRPVAVPASPARICEIKREFSMYPSSAAAAAAAEDQGNGSSRSPTPTAVSAALSAALRSSPVRMATRSPPMVPISPYTARGGMDPSRILDPRLAHLAGVAADPRLGLAHSPSLGFPYNTVSVMNPFYPAAAAMMSSQAVASFATHMAAANLWTPPVSSPSQQSFNSSRLPQHQQQHSPSIADRRPLSPPRSNSRPFPPSSVRTPAHSSAATSGSPLMGGWLPQYRGEPRVSTPMATPTARDTASDEAPLNLSTRR